MSTGRRSPSATRNTVTGEVWCGQIAPADREHFRIWLARRFPRPEEVAFAVEGCTGWRYIAEELQRAGIQAHLAEPADTAAARGRKRRAKTERADARLQRDLLAQGRLPECWISPAHVLDCRALLELYHDLQAEHTAWVQRVHAVLFHQGAPAFGDLSRAGAPGPAGPAGPLPAVPGGAVQIAAYLRTLEGLESELAAVRRRLLAAARRLRGARALTKSIYGVGPVTALALTCWLGQPIIPRPGPRVQSAYGAAARALRASGPEPPVRRPLQRSGASMQLARAPNPHQQTEAGPARGLFTSGPDTGKGAPLGVPEPCHVPCLGGGAVRIALRVVSDPRLLLASGPACP